MYKKSQTLGGLISKIIVVTFIVGEVMNSKTDAIYQQLRDNAEARIEGSELSPLPLMAEANLLHELRVYQIELEMQNEELRRAQLALAESRDRYLDLYEFAPVGYLTLNSQGIIVDINLTGTTLLGVARSKLINHSFAFYVAREARDDWTQHFLHCKKKADKHSFELLLHRPDGSDFWAYLDCHVKQNEGEALSLRITLTDITPIKQAESQLRIAASVFESQQGIMVTDQHKRIVAVNRSFTNITGYESEEVLGRTPRLLRSGRHSADFYRSMWNSLHQTGTWKGEIWNRHKNGDIYPELLQITSVQDGYDHVTHYVATFDDITLSKLAQNEIENLAFYDPLTSLPNRRYLLTRLQEALIASNSNHKYGAILFIDVDNLKLINDAYGHDTGDKLLQQIAQRLSTCVRGDDTVARLGGDEFVVMLTNLSEHSAKAASQAEQTGDQILAALNQVYTIENYTHKSSVSIGVMLFNELEHSGYDLLKGADIAMYRAKQAGRNTVCFFDPEMRAVIAARSKLEEDLRLAVTEQQFRAYYQPQVDCTGKIIGAEILIRWQHPTLGLLMPADFIPLAEDTELIFPIAHWILETACTQI
jgi:diguanylate cyclase (GGDEF)-like protein/PAS domain S-box-containing protein